MEFKTVGVFDNAIDARLFSSKLENEGVECFIENESTMTLDPLLNYAIGGVRVTVEEHNYQEAIKVMGVYSKLPITKEDGQVISCPNCSSNQVQNGYAKVDSAESVIGVLLGLAFMVIPFLKRDKYRCVECNTIFKNKE